MTNEVRNDDVERRQWKALRHPGRLFWGSAIAWAGLMTASAEVVGHAVLFQGVLWFGIFLVGVEFIAALATLVGWGLATAELYRR